MSGESATDHFAARGGLALLHRHWRPGSGGAARLRLAIVHGLAEHSARYDHVGRFFARRGVSVHAYDQRGHGLSEGPRVYTPSFEHLLDDAERFLAHIERADPEGRKAEARAQDPENPRHPGGVLSGLQRHAEGLA